MTDHIQITPLHVVGEDQRGRTLDFSIRESKDFILIERKAGALSGNSYHQGVSPRTNPKLFILLSGRIEFAYRHIEETTAHKRVIEQPSLIAVQPKVAHSVQALTDIIMLECNSIADIQNDRHRCDV